jgi:hypothetical protein
VEIPGDGVTVALHLLPLASFDRPQRLDAKYLHQKFMKYQTLGQWRSMQEGARINRDGVLHYSLEKGARIGSYTLVTYTGCIEAVERYDGYLRDDNGMRTLKTRGLEDNLMRTCKSCMEFMQECDVMAPLAVALTVAGVRDAVIPSQASFGYGIFPITRDPLIFRAVLLNEYPESVASALREVFDSLWQASGYPSCMRYDENGRWEGREDY